MCLLGLLTLLAMSGTGAGFLAMMSARAGAAHVTSCEKIELIAEYARQITGLNGLSDRIFIVGRESATLKVGHDLAERADVLVTEIFSSGLLGEGILPTLEHAHAELLVPGAVVIPRAASALGYLIGGKPLRDKLFVDRVTDFDLGPFADFTPTKIGLCLDHEPHDVLSDDVELIRFVLTDRQFPVANSHVAVPVTRSGICVGVAQWMKLDLDAGTSYENRPSPNAIGATWAHIIYSFPAPISAAAGEVVWIAVAHDRTQIAINLLK